ncbi:MAG: tol-pal system protein YbgF [Azoarcus sp.]|nr:tol-pal system protein YbgF [Azoarcus sp.]
MLRRLSTALLFAVLSASSAQAQVFGSDSRQVNSLREEMNTRFNTISRAHFDLLNQNAALKEEVARLRGQLEVLTHEMESLRARQHDFYVDLDGRVLKLETASKESVAAQQRSGPDPAVEASAYEAALQLLKDGKHAEALSAFRAFITDYPASGFLPNAHFWAGNAALQAKEVAAARAMFDTIVTTWPDNDIVPDALLGLANSQLLLGERRAAQDTLGRIIAQHPDSSAAQVARQRVEQ